MITGQSPDGDSRFATWSRAQALIALVLLLGAITLGVVSSGPAVPAQGLKSQTATDWASTDEALYRAIILRVGNGENYYRAAVDEQIERNYPVRPAMTVREPTVSYLGAALGGPKHLYWLMIAIGLCMVGSLMWRLESLASGKMTWRAAVLLSGLFSAALLKPEYVVDSESWAALFIMLALTSRSLQTYWPSVLCGFLACLFRELALPLLVVMAVLAWWDGKRREAVAWVGAAVVFLAVYAAHLSNVVAVTGKGDPNSPGWLTFGGVPFVIETVRHSSALIVAPAWVTAVVLPLGVLGWLSRKSTFAERVLALLAVYVVAFMVIGRPENSYWGTLYVALIGAGLAFSATGLINLVRVIRTDGANKEMVGSDG